MSIDHQTALNCSILSVKQLVHDSTHTSFVHTGIALFGTIIQLPPTTLAVHTTAHHVPYTIVTTDQSAFHVPPIYGYCVLYELPDAGVVIVQLCGANDAVNIIFHVTTSCLVADVLPSDHHKNIYPLLGIASTIVPVVL